MAYVDFDIRVELSDTTACRVSVLRSPAGEVLPTLSRLPDLASVMPALRGLIHARGANTRRAPGRDFVASPAAPPRAADDYGRELFETLMPPAVLAAYRVSLDRARSESKALRIRLRVDDTTLAVVPWEFAFDPTLGDYLCLSNETSVVRYMDVARPPSTLTVSPPLRVLAVVASPPDLPALDVARERTQLEHAIEHLTDKGVVQVEWLVDATWRDLQSQMRRGPWHVLHFIGHGGLDPVTGAGVLAVCDDDGKTFSLAADDLGLLLSGHHSMRLAVLNSCEGARTDAPDIFSSAGGALIRRGVPAVVAMQFPITDRAALEFSRTFYEALVDGAALDRAVGDARRAIRIALRSAYEWGTPVLHMHSVDGKLFDVDLVSAVFPRKQAPQTRPQTLLGAVAPPAPEAPRPADPAPRTPPPQDLRRGHVLLARKVRGYWVDGVLNRSLFLAAQIELGMDRLENAVDSPWASVLSEAHHTSRQLAAGKTIADVFAEEGGSLLILGEPGSGKTTSMLGLLKRLLDSVEADPAAPIPVVFNLSSWTEGQPLGDWMVDELSAKYQIPKGIGRVWLQGSSLLPLLDGLDEVPEPVRAPCVKAVNEFGESGVCVGAVVCCRIREYLALPNRLTLNTAIQLRDLTGDQVLAWVRAAGVPLAALHEVLQLDSDLLLDARSPLMLSLMAKTYQGVSPDALVREGTESAKARRATLMEAYVSRMFRRAAAGGDRG